jgi:hypothetical protein
MLLDQQETAGPLDDRGDRYVGLPDEGVVRHTAYCIAALQQAEARSRDRVAP